MKRSLVFRLFACFGITLFLLILGSSVGVGYAQIVPSISSAAPVQPVPLITQSIEDGGLVTLHGTVHPLATSAADQGAAPDSLPIGRTMLLLNRGAKQQQALEKLLDDQQNSKSPNYHHWLTPAQFGQQFGAAPEDVRKITQWLENYGFQVEPPMAGQDLIVFSGTHAQLKAAFHTELHRYLQNGQTYYANSVDPQIPAALAPAIRGFVSLNNFPRHTLHSAPRLVKREDAKWKSADPGADRTHPQLTAVSGNETLHAIAPYDLATLYNVQPLWDSGIDGTGQTIAIVSTSDINPADIDSFRSSFGLPAKKLNIIYVGPNPGMASMGAEGEADLDVEWAGAVAKEATIDLVVAGNTPTSGGVEGAAAYIVNNNLASIMNVSYGACEYELGAAGNQFYAAIWQQAAAQGITVFVAAGDSGSASCDVNVSIAQYGLSVSGIASTPYNVAVGGTDLYGSYTAPSQYWNDSNEPTTFQSLKSYVPELPWNNSCASPQILSALQAQGLTDATPEALCNDFLVRQQYLTVAGGAGGASGCITGGSDGVTSCSEGYPKPAWQSGVAGIPADGVRDLPDVSLMAGSGLWSSFYVYCQSNTTPSKTCDVSTEIEGAGGTSFASPIFAGILALVQQQTASAQGNANYIFYKLAATQYGASGNESSCSSANVAAGNACIFYDITQGTNAVPCLSRSPNCTISNPIDFTGILSGYNAGTGYDLTTGLGSVNVANLVNNWSSAASAFISTDTSLTASGSTSVQYGSSITLNVTVSPAGSSSITGTPGGIVGITTNSTTGSNAVGSLPLTGGQASGSVTTLPTGSYQLFAHYAGDTTFASSQSAGLAVAITPGAAITSISAGHATVLSGQKSGVSILVAGIPDGATPTGTVTITNTSTGAVLGSAALAPDSESGSSPSAVVYITVPSSQLTMGPNTITASYSGDGNYLPVAAFSTTINLVAAFTASTNPAALTLAPNASGTVTVTATPAASETLNPVGFSFSCPANMPAGLTCSFSTPTAAAGGAVTSTLTLQSASPLLTHMTQVASVPERWLSAGASLAVAGLLLLGVPVRRRHIFSALSMVALVSLFWLSGCGGGGSSPISTVTTLSVTPKNPAFQSQVTLTAQVTPSSGSGYPTGTVTFSSGSTTIGTATLSSGTASFSTSSLPIGNSSSTASYSGDSKYLSSTSSSSSLDIVYTTSLAITAKDSAGNSSVANLALTIQ